MSAKSDVFVRVACKCPICKRESTHRYLKSKMFQPVTTEDDHFVRKYRWELEQFKKLRPEHLHVWHCPHCHFCDEKEVFRGEDNCGGKLDMIRDKLLVEFRRPESPLVRLGESIDLQAEMVSWSSALAAHLVAIFIQNQLSPNMRLKGKLARLYLRSAWLFREKKYPDIVGGRAPEDPDFIQIFNDLKEEATEIPFDEESAMKSAIEYFKLELETVGRTDNIRQEVSLMFLLVSLYRRLGDKRMSYDYVRMIFQQGTKRRNATQKALEGAIRRDNVTGSQIEHIKSLLKWLNNTVERSSDTAEELSEEIFKEEYPRARKWVMEMENPTPETILTTLRGQHFFEGTCRRVANIFKKNLLDTDPDKLEEAVAAANKAAEEEKAKGFFSKVVSMIKGDEEK
ncbi:MAG: DUF2225 domain-containing protein [Planctomycetes bacterium]|nr:DUF2225 domain-containing protein [Planctomycetota bacterium]